MQKNYVLFNSSLYADEKKLILTTGKNFSYVSANIFLNLNKILTYDEIFSDKRSSVEIPSSILQMFTKYLCHSHCISLLLGTVRFN